MADFTKAYDHYDTDKESLDACREELDRWSEEIVADSIGVSFEEFIANLRRQIAAPRIETSTLWSPRIWTPGEQHRQRRLVEEVLQPHLQKWALEGLCLEDLNFSEFEDLVAGLLFKAGLKIYKVRQAPQGGRDLIARGVLVPGEEPVEMAVEVKHKRIVDRPEVQLALYQNRRLTTSLCSTNSPRSACSMPLCTPAMKRV
jgi:hypothetical protein